MQHTDFTSWFEIKALQLLKQSINHLSHLIDEQTQIYKMESQPDTDFIPMEYLQFQAERCLDSFKTNLLTEVNHFAISNKFLQTYKYPVDKPMCLKNKNSLIQRAKLAASVHTFQSLPQVAFIDLETDGVNIQTANILQIAIIKPIIHSEYDSLNHLQTYTSYISPYKGYSEKHNKAFHINKIGDKQLKSAPSFEDVAWIIAHLLEDTIIVGYNSNSFDIPILKRHLNKYGEQLQHKFSIDLYPACWKNKKQKLGDAIKAYNLTENSNPHDALADTSCSMDLFIELIEKNELPCNEEDLLHLFHSSENIWQHYQRRKVIDINPDNQEYSHLLIKTPESSLKRKYLDISVS